MSLQATKNAHLGRVTVTSIAPFTFSSVTTMQIPFAFFVFFGSVCTDLPAVQAFFVKCTFSFYQREMNFLLMPTPFTPTSCESLDLQYVIAQSVKIGIARLKFV
jgi:hypothetical protein